jgi:hypothetical protein
MYRIIGSDGKEYGPVSADQLRQWIIERRADAATRVLAGDSTQWKLLGSLPEFSLLFATSAPQGAPAPFATGSSLAEKNTGFATASLVLGIASICFCCCCFGFPLNLLGLIFSLIALGQIKNDPERYGGGGMAIAGLLLSILSMLLGMLFFITRLMGTHWSESTSHVYKL